MKSYFFFPNYPLQAKIYDSKTNFFKRCSKIDNLSINRKKHDLVMLSFFINRKKHDLVMLR